jgi:hypothetical protein
MIVLTILSSVGGAIAVVSGFMLVFGAMDTADFSSTTFADRVDDSWWWYAMFLILAIAGLAIQTRDAAAMRRSIRAGWVEPAI